MAGLTLFPMAALLTGFLQYLLLHPYLPRIGWWIPATFLGWPLLILIGYVLSAPVASFPTLAVVCIAFTGVPQWFVLRQHVRRASLWILAIVLGWGAVFLVSDGTISTTLDVIAIMLLPPAAASITLWLLLDKLPSSESNGGNTTHNMSPEPPVPVRVD